MTAGFIDRDPARNGFQQIEELATAYWYSQVLFSALELSLFGHLDAGADTPGALARVSGSRPAVLLRLLRAMKRLGLVDEFDGRYYNSQATSRFLVPGRPDYMGEFFLYRQYMRPGWETLTSKTTLQPRTEEEELSYEEKNYRYVRAMDTLVRQKAREIAGLVARENIRGPILDVGGGAGSLTRAVREQAGSLEAVLFDIPEVIDAARRIFPEPEDWEGITRIAGDFRSHEFDGQRFGVIFLSNFLHAYSPEEAEILLKKAAGLLNDNGLIVIHDYFPDVPGVSPAKGALYDLAMMLNTYNGGCHTCDTVTAWCRDAGLATVGVKALETDSAVMFARASGTLSLDLDPLEAFARTLNLEAFVPLSPSEVVTASWVREKCRTGCALYDKGLQCPPHGMDYDRTRKMLDEYSRAYLIRATPPGRDFHNTLLALEKKAFLAGFHKAFAFGAGPCVVCPECPNDGTCRFPHLARPAMEASGIDVYTTAANAGIRLKPVQEKGQYVTYIGLLLVE